MSTKEQLWSSGRERVLNAPQLYVDVDVEADGIAGYGSMLSIGAASPTGETFYSEIRPYSKKFMSGHRQFCEEHGLEHERLMDEAPLVEVVMERYRSWLADVSKKTGKKAVLTAFNAAFDWAHVDLAFAKTRLDNPHGIAAFDLKTLAMPLVDWNWNHTKKSKLPAEILPDGDFTHHALEDAQYQQKIHFGLAALLGTKYDNLTNAEQLG
jgi:DNA polymerase III epsilon subunit-like protein